MKRITFNLSPRIVVPDDTSRLPIERQLVDALRALDLPGFEGVSVSRGGEEPAREGFCQAGQHTFYAPHYFPADEPVPNVCPQHAYNAAVDGAQAEHQPLFDLVEASTGLKGHIWQSGGMTMTMVWPLDPTNEDSEAPCYMGLQEGVDDTTGRWFGTTSFYRTRTAVEDGSGDDVDDVVMAYDRDPNSKYDQSRYQGGQTIEEWAERIIAHFNGLPEEFRRLVGLEVGDPELDQARRALRRYTNEDEEV